jgi:hypothetical protein
VQVAPGAQQVFPQQVQVPLKHPPNPPGPPVGQQVFPPAVSQQRLEATLQQVCPPVQVAAPQGTD